MLKKENRSTLKALIGSEFVREIYHRYSTMVNNLNRLTKNYPDTLLAPPW